MGRYTRKKPLPLKTLMIRIAMVSVPAIVLVLAITLVLKAFGALPKPKDPDAASTTGSAASEAAPQPSTITLLGSGDNLIHSPILDTCLKEDGSYDFKPIYTQIKPVVSAADIAFMNQESVMAPNQGEFMGYPVFNSPQQVGDALVDAGYDVISQGNNHMLDMGADGLKETLDYWAAQPVKVVGAYQNEEDLQNIRILEKNGFKVAYIGVVEMTNGISLPENSPLQIVYTHEEDRIKALIEKARAAADIVVVSAHWGEEDVAELSETETGLSQKMVNWGADVIFGNHPHVLQDLKVLTRESDGAKCPVMYAFNNLISTQEDPHNLVGGLLTVTYERDETGKVFFQDMKFKPVVTYYERGGANVHVQWLKDFTDEMAQQSRTWDKTNGEFTPAYAKGEIDRCIPKEYQDWT